MAIDTKTARRAKRIHAACERTRHPFQKGADNIVRRCLGLPDDTLLPITIPHGIDTYQSTQPIGLHSIEPLYLASNEDCAVQAEACKPVLRFPHPWLLLTRSWDAPRGCGTLFVAPPPSAAVFEQMHARIMSGDYEKPWSVLIKDRELRRDDVAWWESRGFMTQSAGAAVDPDHFYKLRDILRPYRCVATPYMSSVAIFAAAIDKRILAIPDVRLACIETSDWPDVWKAHSPATTRVWRALTSPDPAVARAEALRLLGADCWAEPTELAARLSHAIESVADAPLHLHPLRRKSLLYRLCVVLEGAGLPIHRLFPSPVRKITDRLAALLRVNRLTLMWGSDFGHYGVAGADEAIVLKKAFAFQVPGRAVPGGPIRQPPAASPHRAVASSSN